MLLVYKHILSKIIFKVQMIYIRSILIRNRFANSRWVSVFLEFSVWFKWWTETQLNSSIQSGHWTMENHFNLQMLTTALRWLRLTRDSIWILISIRYTFSRRGVCVHVRASLIANACIRNDNARRSIKMQIYHRIPNASEDLRRRSCHSITRPMQCAVRRICATTDNEIVCF